MSFFFFKNTASLQIFAPLAYVLFPLGKAVTKWLWCRAPNGGVWVQAQAGVIVFSVFLNKTLYTHSASLHPGV